MSKEPGTPPKGESASADFAPQSRPIEASELDEGWGDEPIEAGPAAVLTGVAREQQEGHTASSDLPVASETDAAATGAFAAGEVGSLQESSSDEKGEPVTVASAAGEVAAGSPAAGEVDALQQPLAESKGTPSILPQSLSPVILSTTEGTCGALPAEATEPAVPVKSTDVASKKASTEAKLASAEPVETKPAAAKEHPKHSTKISHTGSRLRKRLKSGYVMFPVAVLAAGIALIVLRPKRIARELPSPAQAPAVAAQVPVQVVDQPIETPKQDVAQAAPSANAVPVDSAGIPPLATAAASADPLPSASAASGDSFLDAFHKNAAKSNARWAEIKTVAGKTDNGKAGTAKAAAAKPAAAKPASPGQADPLDVLKRLEEARKNKK